MLRAKNSGPNKLCTDYRLAKILGLSKTAMTRYMRHGGGMSSDVGLKIAKELGLDANYVVACLAHEREQSELVRPVWAALAEMAHMSGQTGRAARRAKRVSKVAAAALALGFMGFGAPSPSYCATGAATSSVYYVQSWPGSL